MFFAATWNGTTGAVDFFVGDDQLDSALFMLSAATVSPFGDHMGTTGQNTVEFRVGGTAAVTSDRTPNAWFDDMRVYNQALGVSDLDLIRKENLVPEPSGCVLLIAGAAALLALLVMVRLADVRSLSRSHL